MCDFTGTIFVQCENPVFPQKLGLVSRRIRLVFSSCTRTQQRTSTTGARPGLDLICAVGATMRALTDTSHVKPNFHCESCSDHLLYEAENLSDRLVGVLPRWHIFSLAKLCAIKVYKQGKLQTSQAPAK